MASADRPQERLEMFGASALGDEELLAMLLRSGSKDMDVLAVARQLLLEAGYLRGFFAGARRTSGGSRGWGM
jgi:DNA repair protein RadC